MSLSTVLIVDDDAAVRGMLTRKLGRLGYATTAAGAVKEALEHVSEHAFDVILSDVRMPGTSGLDFLRELRRLGQDLPVVFLTGSPSVAAASKALEYGAFRYLTKPLDDEALERALLDAVRAGSLARAKASGCDRVALAKSFAAALDTLWMAFQPIVSCASRGAVAYEALLRSREPSLPSPPAVIDAAERLGEVHALGRRVRSLVAEAVAAAPPGVDLFVNMHPADLADPDLIDPSAPLSAHARRVVLELTERSTLEAVPEVEARIVALRKLGYRIAVDDLGAGYAGLGYFASLRPEIVKIDMSLVRGVDADPVKKRVVGAITQLGSALGILVVGEGVETAAERDALVDLGCTHLQGYLFAKPAPPFVTASWGP